MSERISEEKINQVRQSIDIVELISEYVHLKKQGRNFVGLCPFHGENTPSFSVSPEKQIFHCFGCHAGGNVFTFLMEIEGISFQEALMKLAKRANIHLDLHDQKSTHPASHESTRLIEIHELVRKLYHHLLVNTNEGQEALEYLHKRQFTKEMIDEFQIGFALNKKDFLYNYLKQRGYSEELLIRSGLILRNDDTLEYYDRFRERIIFPIFDNKGNTVAFSGRILKEGQPKYLNSPESLIFHKSKILYNFHKARPNIRKKQFTILFEGFADCISAFQAGVDNGIATMGTALTDEHVNLIKRITDRVVLCFDADSAGQNATYKAGEMLQNAGCSVQVAIIPNGKDPDEYIKTYGPDKFMNEVIGSSLTFMAYKMKYLRAGKNLHNEGEKLSYIENILVEIAKLDKAIEQDYYLRQIADEFSISLDALKKQLRQIAYSIKKGKPIIKTQINANDSLPNKDKKQKHAYYNAERMLIAHMLKSVHIANKVQEKMKHINFNIDEHQAIVAYLYAFYEAGNVPDLSNFLTFLNDPELQKITTEIGMLNINDEPSDKEIQDYISHVLKYQKMQKIEQMKAEMKEAMRVNDSLKAAELAKQIMKLL